MNNSVTLTVSQLNFYIKSVIESDFRLTNIYISGEISNFVHHYRTGHLYFTLKDEFSALKCVMFAFNAKRLNFAPEDGMKVIVKGKISVFERDGVYQLYADDIQPDGAGALAIAFEQLKNKLSAEGLFDEDHKKNVPKMPNKIGVITSDTGAAVRDIENVIKRRFPLCEILLYPVTVQGSECAVSNVKALKYFNENKNVDVIIIGRGGGSIEDLWGYNDERLVRAVYESEIPVISGVGHEIDFTLCDFAADLRAPTPSAAAELAVPDVEEICDYIKNCEYKLKSGIESKISDYYDELGQLKLELSSVSPTVKIKDSENRFSILKEKLGIVIDTKMKNCSNDFELLCNKLIMLNPVKMLKNGNLIAFNNEKRVRTIKDININDTIKIKFVDGEAQCTVTDVIIGE